jgi:hypothetical protein
MANYNKSFNFRNGVQVDSDNFIVNSTGLVGIGTSIPIRFLDVHGASALRGQTDVTGITSTSNLRVAGIATFHGNVGIGTTNPTGNALVGNTNVLNCGVVTANYFFGSGLYMDDIVGFTTEGWVVHQAAGSGTVRSGIATHLKVGIGTTEANNIYDLMIGQNPTTAGLEGIGFIGETGDTSGYGNQIIASGQIKANSFVGIGTELTQLHATYLATGTVNNDRLPVIDNSKFPTTTIIDSGNGTLEAKFVNLSPTVGVVTAGIFTGTSSKFYGQHIGNVTGNADTATTLVSNANVKTSGTLDAVNQVGAAASFSDSLGIQTSSPNGELHIVAKTGAATAQITSPDQASQLVLGLNAAVQNSNNAFIQYGNRSASFPYSQPAALDFINFSNGTHQGNMNFYSDGASAGVNTGSFYWHTNGTNRLMALTYEGNLGIGVTLPHQKLEVNGIGTFTSNLYVGGDLEVKNELRAVSGVVSANGFIGGFYGESATSVVDIVSVGCTNLNVTGLTTCPYIQCGIGGTIIIGDPQNLSGQATLAYSPALIISSGGGTPTSQSFFKDDGYLGIKTDIDIADGVAPGATGLYVGRGAVFNSFVGIGTTQPKVGLDLSAASDRIEDRMVILPKVTTTQRNALSVGNTHDGALLYNITLGRLEFYNGSKWCGIGTTNP